MDRFTDCLTREKEAEWSQHDNDPAHIGSRLGADQVSFLGN
jgi:hypothetical protein